MKDKHFRTSVYSLIFFHISYILWTLESLVQYLNIFPLYQNKIPQMHHSAVKDIFVIIGLTNPSAALQSVMNLERPYPQRFLTTVTLTKMEPVTGL